MKIAAITKFKNGLVWQALKQAGWSQNDLARKTGIAAARIGLYLNLRKVPNEEAKTKIQLALGEAGVYLDIDAAWPEELEPLEQTPVIEQVADVNDLTFLGGNYAFEEVQKRLADIEADHPKLKKDFKALREYYSDPHATLASVGKKVGVVSRERVRQRITKALRVIRAHITERKENIVDIEGADVLAKCVTHYQAELREKGAFYIENLRRLHNEQEYKEGRTSNERCKTCGYWLKFDHWCENCAAKATALARMTNSNV